MTLKQTIRRLLLMDIWSFTMYDFAKNKKIDSKNYEINFVSNSHDAFVCINDSFVTIRLNNKYDLPTLYLIKDLKRKFPTSKFEIIINE